MAVHHEGQKCIVHWPRTSGVVYLWFCSASRITLKLEWCFGHAVVNIYRQTKTATKSISSLNSRNPFKSWISTSWNFWRNRIRLDWWLWVAINDLYTYNTWLIMYTFCLFWGILHSELIQSKKNSRKGSGQIQDVITFVVKFALLCSFALSGKIMV